MSRTLDAKGLVCPLPVLKTRKALRDLATGECLSVVTTDPASTIDFRHFCDMTGNELVEWSEADGIFTFVIRKTE